MPVGRVFLLESPNALDYLDGTGETASLANVCKLFGYKISTFLIRDVRELDQSLIYISSIGWGEKQDDLPIFIHLSAHGNNKGLKLGQDDVSWSCLAELVVKTYDGIHNPSATYPGPIVLVISSCNTDGTQLTENLTRSNRENLLSSPPSYVFVFEDKEVDWYDAVVTWTIFYRWAATIEFDAKRKIGGVQRFLKKLNRTGFGKIRYFRWDHKKKRYRTYPRVGRSD